MARDPKLSDAASLAKKRLGDLITDERRRARFHIDLIRRGEQHISNDRIAQVILRRWTRLAAVEGGLTGAVGFIGVPLNFIFFTYCQLAAVVSVAECYDVHLSGPGGEDAVLSVLGRAHGVNDLVRESPRLLGEVARILAVRHGLESMGRLVPLAAIPISALLNRRQMNKTGVEALRRFGHVVMIE